MNNFFTGNTSGNNFSRDFSKGKSFQFSGTWNRTTVYNNDGFIQDFVVHNQKLWACIKNVSVNSEPSETNNDWVLILDGVSDVEFRKNPENQNEIQWKYEDDEIWRDLIEFDVVSEDQIKKMLEDLDIKYGNTYDTELSETSTNAVQNQAIAKKFKKLDTELEKKASQTEVDESVEELDKKIFEKVDKVSGKGLSTNDFNNEYKVKLDNLNSSLNNTLSSAKSYTDSEITKVDNKINSEISRAETNISSRINDLEEDLVNALNEAKEYTNSLADGEVKNNTNKINTLNGTGEGSVVKTVKDEIAKVVDGAPEQFNTLKEISEYLNSHEDVASGLVESITKLETEKLSVSDIDSALSITSENPVMNKVITEELGKKATNEALGALSESVASLESKKADKDGVYSGMTVGRSIDLLGVEDVEEGSFLFRPTDGNGSIKDGVAVVKSVKGDSVVWNQLMENGDFSKGKQRWTVNNNNSFVVEDGVATITLESMPTLSAYAYLSYSSDNNYIVGHKYYISAEGNIPRQTTLEIQASLSLLTPSIVTPSINTWTRVAVIGEGIKESHVKFAFFAKQTVGDWEVGDQYKVRNYQIIDLTQMFGAGNEPTTIEEFYQRIPMGIGLNAYNEGEVVNMKASAIKSVGFNAWDEEWESGSLSVADGGNLQTKEAIRNKNYIKVLPKQEYYFKMPAGYRFVFYDEQKNYISGDSKNTNQAITTPSNCHYLKFSVGTSVNPIATYNHDIGINLVHSGYRNGEYEPYVEDVLALPTLDLFPNGMNKIGDVYDEYDDEKSVQRIGIRPYQSGDESIENVLTDGTSTFYVLEEPIVTPHDYRLAYRAWDFGTEQVIADGNTTAITAGITYEFNARDTIRSNKTRLDTLEPIVAGKIDKVADDYYPQLAVGLADNLSGVDVVDSEVNFRRSGGGAISDGVARIEAIKGNSVVWNQLYPTGWNYPGNGVRSESVDGVISIEGTMESSAIVWRQFNANVLNHKYLFILSGASSNMNGKQFALLNRQQRMTISGGAAYLFHTNNNEAALRHIGIDGLAVDEVVSEKNIRLSQYDLTQMFGAGNEPTTIEEFYQRIPMGIGLNAYNEGEVIHMDVQSIESQGVNAWDGVLETAWKTSKIRCLSNEQYCLCGPYYNAGAHSVHFYDSEDNEISRTMYMIRFFLYSNKNSIFTTPANCAYFVFEFNPNFPFSDYKDQIVISLYDTSINGKYFPYIKRVEDLSIIRKYFPQGMKSAGAAHDEVYYDKMQNKKFAVQRMGQVNAWELAWDYMGISESNPYGRFSASVNGRQINRGNILCAIYTHHGASYTTDKNIFGAGGANTIIVIDSAYTDRASFKAMLQEKQVVLYYELAEPIVTELDAEDQFKDLDYQVWNCGTEKAIAEGKSAPLAADITYGFNAIGKIKELEEQITTLMTQMAQMRTQISSMG